MNVTARAAALEALLQVDENEGYSNIVIDKTLNKYELDKRDSALASIIFYGVIEKRVTLDYYIRRFLRNKAAVLSPATANILRMAVYQILYLEKVPDSAAVNEAANLAKVNKCPVGFVNGLLREFLRHKDDLKLPPENSDEYLSVKYSVSRDIVSMWIKSYGKTNTIKLLESFTKKSKMFVRVNSTKISTDDFIASFGEDITVEKYDDLDFACKLISAGNVTKLKQFEDGLFHVQDLSSQYLCKILAPKPGENIIDVCAAPGGKTFTISEMMNCEGKVYSYDLYKGRVKLIRAGAYRLGLTNVLAAMRDATSEKCELNDADRILCDVPCSGFGTLRRKPEIRYKRMKDVEGLPEIQYDILCKSSNLLKAGGTLVYSTCTLNPAENGMIVEKFLSEHPDFEGVKIESTLRRSIDEPEYQLTMMPYAGETDGFFVAKLRKKQ